MVDRRIVNERVGEREVTQMIINSGERKDKGVLKKNDLEEKSAKIVNSIFKLSHEHSSNWENGERFKLYKLNEYLYQDMLLNMKNLGLDVSNYPKKYSVFLKNIGVSKYA